MTTHGVSLRVLDAMLYVAVVGYFEHGLSTKRVRLHFSEDPVLALA